MSFRNTSRPRLRLVLCISVAAMATGCNPRSDAGPVVVSAIGGHPRLEEATKGRLAEPTRLLLDSVAQGLVRFDAVGQITPGMAERWNIVDDGRTYIFRLREAEWSDGQKVTAEQVVTILKRHIAANSPNPLAPYLTAIDEIVEMTPQVIEVRLRRPRPDLLKLFAQPELAIFDARRARGTGPFRIASTTKARIMLRPAFDPARAASDDVEEPSAAQSVELIGERAAKALVRFTERQSDLVTGGSFVDWPLVPLAGIAPANLKFDPAPGLFGLAVVDRDGFLGDPANRSAIAQAIDREAIVAAFAPGWDAAYAILPDQLDSAAAPAMPPWRSLSGSQRREGARTRVERWQRDHPGSIPIRIALPDGPGANILFGFVGAALRGIGLDPRRVALNDPADLMLVDAVAPYDSARWYLATACVRCSEEAQAALVAARDAATLDERARQIMAADAALNDDVAFITLARPLRWSVVALRLRQWQGNARAWHPLNKLRDESN